MRKTLLIVSLLLIAAVLAACGGGTPEVPPTSAPQQPEATQPEVQATEPPAEPTTAPVEAPAEPTEAPTEAPVEPTAAPAAEIETGFPIVDDVQNFMQLSASPESINYQTSLSIEEVVAFYREQLSAQGLTEREITTMIDEAFFSIVFDGAENGQALVVQGTDLGGGLLNVNVRYEDI